MEKKKKRKERKSDITHIKAKLNKILYIYIYQPM